MSFSRSTSYSSNLRSPSIMGRRYAPNTSAASVYAGAGGSGSRISVARTTSLGSSLPGSSSGGSYGISLSGSGVVQNEKETMQDLNDRLASYLERVRSLETDNRKLELQIREFMDKKGPRSQDWSRYFQIIEDLRNQGGGGTCRTEIREFMDKKGPRSQDWSRYFQIIEDLRNQPAPALLSAPTDPPAMHLPPAQIFESAVGNARIVLQIDNARLAADDFRVKFESELAIRQSVESDINGLRKVLDDTNMSRLQLEGEIESLREELIFMKKNHQDEVDSLQAQIANSGLTVEVDAAQPQDLGKVMAEIRAQYDTLAQKNMADLDQQWNQMITQSTAEITENTKEIEVARSSVSELRRTCQTLEIELESLRNLKASLEANLRDVEQHYVVQMEHLNGQLLRAEAELAQHSLAVAGQDIYAVIRYWLEHRGVLFDSFNGDGGNTEAGFGDEEDDDDDEVVDSSQQASGETGFPDSQELFLTLDLEPVPPEPTQGCLLDPAGGEGTSAKKKNKKGKTLTLTDFLAEDGGSGGGGGTTFIPKPVSWADETDDLEGDVSTTWHSNDDDMYRAAPIDRSILPTAPRAAREPNIDRSRLPKSPPYTAFLGNLPYDVSEESIKDFFRGLNISAVRLPREPTNPERLKGFGYAEFEDLDSLLRALSLNEESLGNRRIRVDVADQAQDKDRDDRSFGRDRDRNRDSERFETDWRARPATDSFDDYPPRRSEDSFGDRYRDRDRYNDSDRYRDGPRRDMDRFGGRDRYDDRSRDYDRGGYDSRVGSGRRAFGTGYRRDDDFRGGGDRYEDRYERRDDRVDRWSSRDDYARDDIRRDDRGEERLQKEQEKLQRQLEDDKPRLERRPRERHPSWRSEENQERSRTGSESSQTGSTGPSVGTGPTGRTTRRRESEKSLENETFSKEDDAPSPTSKTPKEEKLPLKVMPAPPPKENAWVKRSSNPPARSLSSDMEQHSPTSSSQGGPAQLSEDRAPPKSASRKGDENKPDEGKESVPKARGGPGDGGSRDHWQDSDRKESKNDHDSQSASEPKKPEENTASKFSYVSKYAALSVDGEDEVEEDNYTD
ncbi:Eukaryotic translation initiation factor 4B [Chelonia mydas]|uniref:Eukaryotic translation initiation factor 4B n=1 Tax=Chelonia mydas TaxID=8469 RepID=M7BIE4_CHEMY|nr:Eukaryotic translation initiation factor 4B [Chelonia mydas]